MKVVQINAVCDTGSTGRICRELNDELIQRGHEGLILYGNGYSEYEFAHKVSGKYEVKLHGLLSRVLGKNAAYSPLSTGKIIGILKAYQPDIVHLGNLHGNYVTLKPLLRYLAKQDIPTVLTLHDCWFFTGKCTHYTVAGCNRWQTGCHHCPRRLVDIPSWFFDRTEEMWREKRDLFAAIPRLAVISVSDWITHEAEQSFLKEALIRQRIYNWVDLSVFYPRGKEGTGCVPVSEDKFSVLCVSAGWKQETSKTKDLLALAQLLPEDYEIILAGRVPFADKLPSNIKVVGYLSSAEALAKLYSACDVYVHLSREDTFGKVIAEALACGTPAVVYGSTACPEILGPGCGYAVDVGDVISVCQGIQRIRQKTKEAYSKCCTEYARANFAKEKLVEDTLELYKRLIGSK